MDQVELLHEVLQKGITAIISGVFAEPLDKSYLGAAIDSKMIERLAKVGSTHHINPAGEGGEIETTVLDAPIFKKKIVITKNSTEYANYSGVFAVEDARLEQK